MALCSLHPGVRGFLLLLSLKPPCLPLGWRPGFSWGPGEQGLERLPSVHLCPVTLPLTPFRSCLDSGPQTWTPLQAHGRELWSVFLPLPLSVSRLTIWEWCSWSMAGAPVSQLNGVSPSTVWAVVLRSVTMTVSSQSFTYKCLLRTWTPSPQGSAPGVGCAREKRLEHLGPGVWAVYLGGIYRGAGTFG